MSQPHDHSTMSTEPLTPEEILRLDHGQGIVNYIATFLTVRDLTAIPEDGCADCYEGRSQAIHRGCWSGKREGSIEPSSIVQNDAEGLYADLEWLLRTNGVLNREDALPTRDERIVLLNRWAANQPKIEYDRRPDRLQTHQSRKTRKTHVDTRIDLAKTAGNSPPTSHRLCPRQYHSRIVREEVVVLHCELAPNDDVYLTRCAGRFPSGARCPAGLWNARDTLCDRHLDQAGYVIPPTPEGGQK